MQCFTVYCAKIENRLDPSFYVSLNTKMTGLVEIGKIAKIQGGFAFKSNEYTEKGIPLVRIQNIVDSEIDLSDTVFIDKKNKDELLRFLLTEDDILIAMTGATIGKVGRINKDKLPAFLNQRVGRFIIKSDEIKKNYFYYILQLPFFQQQVKRFSLGGAQPNISPSSIETIKIPLPSVKIQNCIVDLMQYAYEQKKQKEAEAQKLLDSIDDYVLNELGIKLPELKDKKCYAVNSSDIKERLDPYYYQPKFKELYKMISSYKNTRLLKDVVNELDYGLMPTQDYALSEKEGIPMIRVTNILQNGNIDMSDIKYIPFNTPRLDLKRVKENDILMVQCGSTTGKIAIVPKKYENYTFGSFSFVIRGKKEIANQYYLWAILFNRLAQEQIRHTWNIVTVRPNTSKPNIENLLIPIPSMASQNKIAEEVKRRMTRAEQLKAEARKILEQAKQKVEEIILGKK